MKILKHREIYYVNLLYDYRLARERAFLCVKIRFGDIYLMRLVGSAPNIGKLTVFEKGF